MPNSPMSFFWYELMTTDVDAAEAFYKTVVGWKSEPFDSRRHALHRSSTPASAASPG